MGINPSRTMMVKFTYLYDGYGGETSMFEVTYIDTNLCCFFLKAESVKDCIIITIIKQIEKLGDTSFGDTIVEATVGNMNLGLVPDFVDGYLLMVVSWSA